MKVAQRAMMGAAAMAFAITTACTNAGGLGGLGNILGGVLGQPSTEVGATVQNVDTRNQVISVTQSNGQSLGLYYDNRTRVLYQNQLYNVTSLEYGDQIVAHLIDQGNGSYYTDSVYVTAPVNGSTTTNGSANGAVMSMQGTVRQIDRNAGWFAIDGGNGVQITVTLPYRANSNDVNRFNGLRVGDYVRFYGVYVNSNRMELRGFN